MNKKAYTLLNVLLAIIAISFILIAVSTAIYWLLLPGLLCFLIIYLFRSAEIRRMNDDLDSMNSDQFLDHEEDRS